MNWTLGSTRARWEGTRRGAQCAHSRNKRKTNENARQVWQGTQTQYAQGAKRPSMHGYSQQTRNERGNARSAGRRAHGLDNRRRGERCATPRECTQRNPTEGNGKLKSVFSGVKRPRVEYRYMS